MELTDIGRTMDATIVAPQAESKDKKYYPTINIDNPPEEIASKPVGHVCRLTVVAKVKGTREIEGGSSIELEIQKVGYASAGQKTKDEYLGMKKEDRENYDKSSVVDEDPSEKENDESENG